MTVERWYPIHIEQSYIPTGFEIKLVTSVPCHLWLLWTDHVPWVHRAATTRRGLIMPWDNYWCFVTWYLIEQQEAGDTVLHTFLWPDWIYCQTKYFRFHGTIGGLTSPSDSPIFRKHYDYLAPEEPYFFDYETIGIYDYNAAWVACSFECLKTGSPEKIGIWLYNWGDRDFDMHVYIEESVNQPPGILVPYDDITGHSLCRGTIPYANINAHYRVLWYHEVTLDWTDPLVAGVHYIFSSNDQDAAKAYRYRVRDVSVANAIPTYWQDGAPNYPTRSWTQFHNLKVKAGRLL